MILLIVLLASTMLGLFLAGHHRARARRWRAIAHHRQVVLNELQIKFDDVSAWAARVAGVEEPDPLPPWLTDWAATGGLVDRFMPEPSARGPHPSVVYYDEAQTFRASDLAALAESVDLKLEPFQEAWITQVLADPQISEAYPRGGGWVPDVDMARFVAQLHEIQPADGSITCPTCERTSYHPDDVEHGWCSACAAFTSPTLAERSK